MRRLLPLLLGLVSTACLSGTPDTSRPLDSTVRIRSSAGTELGVATDYGVVFLGRTAREGEVALTAWFGDGPSWESGTVEAVGGGVYATRAEIRLPTVPLDFDAPRPGTEVRVRGRLGHEPWETPARVADHPAVAGLLLRSSEALRRLGGDQVGAGVYVGPREAERLVGLVSGRLRLRTAGGEAEFVTVVGPETLWRVPLSRREREDPQPVYREDVL